MWIEYENKIYDIRDMYNIRTIPMIHLLGPPQYSIQEPIHLEIKADNHKDFSSQLKLFNPQLISRTLLNIIKNLLKKSIKKLKNEIFQILEESNLL